MNALQCSFKPNTGITLRLRASLQDFDSVLNLGFLTMLVLYALVASCGYYYFGHSAHELVTADLKINSPISHVSIVIPGFTVDKLVSAFILCNAFTTYPNLLLVIQVSLRDFGIE